MAQTPTPAALACRTCGQPQSHPHHDGRRWPGRLSTNHPYHPFVPAVSLVDVRALIDTARYEASHGSAIGCAGLVKNLCDALERAAFPDAERATDPR